MTTQAQDWDELLDALQARTPHNVHDETGAPLPRLIARRAGEDSYHVVTFEVDEDASQGWWLRRYASAEDVEGEDVGDGHLLTTDEVLAHLQRSDVDQGPDVQPMTLEQWQADRDRRGYLLGDRVRVRVAGGHVGTVVDVEVDLGTGYVCVDYGDDTAPSVYRARHVRLAEIPTY